MFRHANFRENCENAPSRCVYFSKKCIFCSMALVVSAVKFLCKNTKNSWRTNFLKIISSCKNRSRCTTLKKKYHRLLIIFFCRKIAHTTEVRPSSKVLNPHNKHQQTEHFWMHRTSPLKIYIWNFTNNFFDKQISPQIDEIHKNFAKS